MTTFTASAHCATSFPSEAIGRLVHFDKLNGFGAMLCCTDMVEAEAVAAVFPKYVKAKARGLSGVHGLTACVTLDVWFNADDVNKGTNETGIKRVRKFLELAQIEWKCEALNGYKTFDDFMAAFEAL